VSFLSGSAEEQRSRALAAPSVPSIDTRNSRSLRLKRYYVGLIILAAAVGPVCEPSIMFSDRSSNAKIHLKQPFLTRRADKLRHHCCVSHGSFASINVLRFLAQKRSVSGVAEHGDCCRDGDARRCVACSCARARGPLSEILISTKLNANDCIVLGSYRFKEEGKTIDRVLD
jgi:hypothetical protein